MNYRLSFKILTISLFILACESPKPEVDISKTDLNIQISRLEKGLFEIRHENLTPADMLMLEREYGNFFNLFTRRIISVGRAGDSATAYYLDHFRKDPQVAEIAGVTLQTFTDISDLDASFTDAFKRYHVLFPEKIVPEVYTYISAFSYTIVVTDSLLGIGLDMYLGSDNNYYKRLGIPAYRVHNMNRENILPDCMKSWLSTEFELPPQSDDLLSSMVYHGKILYALDVLLPDVPDSVKIGYTAREIQWVKDNAQEMWFHFADKELFYNQDPKQIQKYIGEGPFTAGFPEGSPGMTGRWVGWQIVRKYMEQKDPLDLKSLFEEKDARAILKASKYKPQ